MGRINPIFKSMTQDFLRQQREREKNRIERRPETEPCQKWIQACEKMNFKPGEENGKR